MKYILTVIVMILSNCTIVMTQVQASQGAVNALFCNVIVVKIPLTLLGEFLLEANFRMFYFSKGSFVRVITLTMTLNGPYKDLGKIYHWCNIAWDKACSDPGLDFKCLFINTVKL